MIKIVKRGVFEELHVTDTDERVYEFSLRPYRGNPDFTKYSDSLIEDFLFAGICLSRSNGNSDVQTLFNLFNLFLDEPEQEKFRRLIDGI